MKYMMLEGRNAIQIIFTISDWIVQSKQESEVWEKTFEAKCNEKKCFSLVTFWFQSAQDVAIEICLQLFF